jgi:hypothetical protein
MFAVSSLKKNTPSYIPMQFIVGMVDSIPTQQEYRFKAEP